MKSDDDLFRLIHLCQLDIFRPEVRKISHWQIDRHSRLRRHHHNCHIPPEQRDNEEYAPTSLPHITLASVFPQNYKTTYLLQFRRHGVIPGADLPIRAAQNERAHKGTEEDKRKDGVCFEGEYPRCE